MMIPVLFVLVVCASADYDGATWAQPCDPNEVTPTKYGCASIYASSNVYCQPNAPAPSTASRSYNACWCGIGVRDCCGNGNQTVIDAWCTSHGYLCQVNGSYTSVGHCNTVTRLCDINCPAQTIDELPSVDPEMPISSAVALIFVAFFIGIILSYVVYKFRKSSKKYTEPTQALSESSHQSAEDSRLGERPLNVAPLSEQV